MQPRGRFASAWNLILRGVRCQIEEKKSYCKRRCPDRLWSTAQGRFSSSWVASTKEFIASLKEIQDWFTGFHVEEIELSIGFGAKDGLVTKLFVSFEGKAGCKIILKPNP